MAAPSAAPKKESMLPSCWPAPTENAAGLSTKGKLVAHVLHEDWFTWTRPKQLDFLKTEILLGITICFAQVPESVAFAFMAHIRPPVALHAAWIVGLICTLLGGRSGMVNGAEGAFAAIISTMVAEPLTPGDNGEGIELLFPSVMCAGFFMLLIWLVRGDRFITLMAASIMDGFCCGLAIVIGQSQLHPFQLGHGANKTYRPGDSPITWYMVLIMMCSMLTMEFVPKLPFKAAKLLPSSLLAIIVAIVLEYAIVRQIDCNPEDFVDAHGHRRSLASGSGAVALGPLKCKTDVIGDVTPFSLTYPYPFFLDPQYRANNSLANEYAVSGDQAGTIIVQGLLLAIAGVVQGLMTTEVVTSFVKTPPFTPSIVWSMGVANLLSGFLGGMGGDAMIGLSTINCLNGGRGRLAPTVTALGVMLCTIVAYPVLNFIPISSLAGVMIVVVLHTFKWVKVPMVLSALVPASWRPQINSWCSCNCFPAWMRLPLEVDRWEAAIIVVVSVLTIVQNLVYGVGVGLVMAAVKFAYLASLETDVTSTPADGKGAPKRYKLHGKLFFGSSLRFHNFFDVDNDPEHVVLVLPEKPTEYSAVDALNRVSGLYAAQNKTLTIEVIKSTPSSSPSPIDIVEVEKAANGHDVVQSSA